jgi:hypothetical protein
VSSVKWRPASTSVSAAAATASQSHVNMSESEVVRRCLCMGYFGQAAQLQADGSYLTLRGRVGTGAGVGVGVGASSLGSGAATVVPHASSVCGRYGPPPEWVVFDEIGETGAGAGARAGTGVGAGTMRGVSRINPRWLLQAAPHYFNLQENTSTSN